MQRKGRRAAWLLVLLAAVMEQDAGAIEEVPFGSLDPGQRNQVVLMYKSGDEHNEQALDAVLQAEISVLEFVELGISDDAAKIAFKKCDAYEGKNLLEMESKGLTQFPMIFVSIDGQGMEKYVREEVPTAEKFTDYLLTKLEPTTDEDVFPYSEDLITDQYPVFVKFFEKWCSRCVSMRKAFENAATRMAGKVIFMEVECSASDAAQEFCTKHNVDGYPTLKLMGGKLPKALFFERDRSVQTMIDFFKEHVPEALVDKVEEEEAAEGEDADSSKPPDDQLKAEL